VLAANGGPAVPALRRLRLTLAGRLHRHRRSEAQAAQAMASAGLLASAPVLFATVGALIDPSLARLYGREVIGALCSAGALILSAGGWLWMHRLVNRAGSPSTPRADTAPGRRS
jgi:Flp pilus assembly protein TadB